MKRLALIAILMTCGLSHASADAPVPAAEIESADAVYRQRTERAGALEALALYEKAIAQDPSSVPALWKAARACYWLGDHAESGKEKTAAFEKGIGYAEKATALDPRCVDAHFWLGGLYGSYGEAKGILKSLAMLKPIRREMDAVVRLDDRYQGGAGYRVLGIVDYKVPGFAGGNRKRASEKLNKALAIDPANPFNQFYFAEFLSITGEKAKALEHLQTLQTLAPSDDVDPPDLESIQAKGKKLQQKLSR